MAETRLLASSLKARVQALEQSEKMEKLAEVLTKRHGSYHTIICGDIQLEMSFGGGGPTLWDAMAKTFSEQATVYRNAALVVTIPDK